MYLVFWNRILLDETQYTMSGSPAMPTFQNTPWRFWVGALHGPQIHYCEGAGHNCTSDGCVGLHCTPESVTGERLTIIDFSDDSKREYRWNGTVWDDPANVP